MSEDAIKKDNYELCYLKLFERFKTMDFEEAAKASGNSYDKEKSVLRFKFFGADCQLDCITGEMFSEETELATMHQLVIIAHFLRYPEYTGVPMADQLVSLKEVPGGGSIFFPNFKENAIDPLTKAFGCDPKLIYNAIEPLNGKKAHMGHASITVHGFPKFPITLVVWEGDDEIPAASTILYDKSASAYAHIEDVIGLGMIASDKVIAACCL